LVVFYVVTVFPPETPTGVPDFCPHVHGGRWGGGSFLEEGLNGIAFKGLFNFLTPSQTITCQNCNF